MVGRTQTKICLVLVHFRHLFLLLAILHFQPPDFGKSVSHQLAGLFFEVAILDILQSADLKLLQILIDHPCQGLSSNLHLPLVHLLLVLAANHVDSFIGGKALLAAVVLGQTA